MSIEYRGSEASFISTNFGTTPQVSGADNPAQQEDASCRCRGDALARGHCQRGSEDPKELPQAGLLRSKARIYCTSRPTTNMNGVLEPLDIDSRARQVDPPCRRSSDDPRGCSRSAVFWHGRDEISLPAPNNTFTPKSHGVDDQAERWDPPPDEEAIQAELACVRLACLKYEGGEMCCPPMSFSAATEPPGAADSPKEVGDEVEM